MVMKKKKKGGGKRTMASTGKRAAGRKPSPRAAARRGKNKKASSKKSVAAKTRKAPAPRRIRPRSPRTSRPPRPTRRGLGPEAGGQSGDTEGLSRRQLADSESVEELLEEGQAFEAGIVGGVENAPDPSRGRGRGGVRTRQVPEDDVPQEYLDED